MSKLKIITIYLLPAIISVVVPLLIYSSSAHAAEESAIEKIKVKYNQPVHLKIAGSGINRINLGVERLEKIIGDGSTYSVVISDNADNVFLTSKLSAGKSTNLSLLLSSGRVVDIVLDIINAKQPKSIELVFSKDSCQLDERREVANMISAMRRGVVKKYYVQELDRELLNQLPNKIIQRKSYRYGNLYGAELELQNNSDNQQIITTEILHQLFANIISISPDNKQILPPKTSGKAYVVFRGGIDD